MKKLILLLAILSLLACGRTYHVYIWAHDDAEVIQEISVQADVPKTVDTGIEGRAEIDGGLF